MQDSFNLKTEMAELGLTLADLCNLTGKHRASVHRWETGGVPRYVRTILRQQRRIRELTQAVGAAMLKAVPPSPDRFSESADAQRRTLSLRPARAG